MDWGSAAESKIISFLQILRTAGLEFNYVLSGGPGAHGTPGAAATPIAETVPRLTVEITGPDAVLFTERGGELLHAVESMAACILRLSTEENDHLSFDARGFKRKRQEAMEGVARHAIETVRATAQPYVFAPMNSRERRMLHLFLATSGFPTASSGEGSRRFVVLYPIGTTPTPERFTSPAPTRRQWSDDRSRPRAANYPTRSAADGKPQRVRVVAPRTQLDPNGNALEQQSNSQPPALSEQERLASLRRAFRKR